MMMVARLVLSLALLLARSSAAATVSSSLRPAAPDLFARQLELDDLPEGVDLSTILEFGKSLAPKIEKTLQNELNDPTAFSVLERPTLTNELDSMDVSDLCGGDEELNLSASIKIKAINGLGSMKIGNPTAVGRTGVRAVGDATEWCAEYTFESESFSEQVQVVADVVFSGTGCDGLITVLDNTIPDVPITFEMPKMDFVVAIGGMLSADGTPTLNKFSVTSMHFEAEDHVITGGIQVGYTMAGTGTTDFLPVDDLGEALEGVFAEGMDAYVQGNLPLSVNLNAPPRDTFGIGFNQTMSTVTGQPVECTTTQARMVNRIIQRVAKVGNFMADAHDFTFMQELDTEIDLAEKECLTNANTAGGTANDRRLRRNRKVVTEKQRFKKIAKKAVQQMKQLAKERRQQLDNGAEIVCEEDEEEEAEEETGERALEYFVEEVLEETPVDHQGERMLWGDPCSQPETFYWYDCGCGGTCERRRRRNRRRRLLAANNDDNNNNKMNSNKNEDIFRQLDQTEHDFAADIFRQLDETEHDFAAMQATGRELCTQFTNQVPCMDCSTLTVWQIKD